MSKKIYNDNGLPFWLEGEIELRTYITDKVSRSLRFYLEEQNRAWRMYRVEAPSLIPVSLVSEEYGVDDIFTVGEFHLKPETTAASYEYARWLLEHQKTTPPLCVWQLGKSFRRENDQVSANMRLKEFYQLEFQCIVTEDTKNNYQENIIEALAGTVRSITDLETRVVPSDRTPHYSKKTLDIEVKTPHKWLEVMSCSVRNDVPFEWNGKKLINYEFAFGADRLVYAANLEPQNETDSH